MSFLISTENTKNKISLFSVFTSFEKICSLKMKTEIQPNTFPSSCSIFSENKNRKQLNQTPPCLLYQIHFYFIFFSFLSLTKNMNLFMKIIIHVYEHLHKPKRNYEN